MFSIPIRILVQLESSAAAAAPVIQPLADSTLVDLTEPHLMDWCTNSGPFMLMMQDWYY